MYHIGFLRTVLKVLTCVSFRNSKLLVDEATARLVTKSTRKPEERLRRLADESRGIKHCPHTGYPQPTFRLMMSEADGIRVVMEFPKAKKTEMDDGPDLEESTRELLASEAVEILRRISDEDCRMLGFHPKYSRPEWMVITVMPVPPPAVRPAVVMAASARSEDDLTTVLQDVIRENNEIKRLDETGAGDHIIQASVKRMQTRLAGYIDNTLPSMEKLKHGGRPIKSISERLKGKHGRIRGNLMGKRVDFSARTGEQRHGHTTGGGGGLVPPHISNPLRCLSLSSLQ